jgi:UDP-glucose 4-epimerase
MRAYTREEPPEPNLDWVVGDILDVPKLTAAMQGVDRVIHAAGLAHLFRPTEADERQLQAVNADGTRCVTRVAVEAGVSRLVIVSSVSVYGSSDGNRDETAPCRPLNAYGRSKLAGEQYAMEESVGRSIEVVALRLATLYGVGDPGNMRRLIGALNGGWFIQLGNGLNRKSFIHVSDAANACFLAATTPGLTGPYNVAAEPYTVRDIVAAICQALGKRPPFSLPAGLATAGAGVVSAAALGKGRLGELPEAVRKLLGNDEYSGVRFQRDTGFEAQVGLEEGISEEVRWWLAQQS